MAGLDCPEVAFKVTLVCVKDVVFDIIIFYYYYLYSIFIKL